MTTTALQETPATTATDLVFSHVSMLVGDQDEALHFYRDTVGLEVRTDVPLGPLRWVTVGPAGSPGVEIVLEVPEMIPDQARAEAARARLSNGAQSTIIFTSTDVDTTFARLQAAGVPVEQEVIDQPYGVRDCGFTDPWGNQIRFSQVAG